MLGYRKRSFARAHAFLEQLRADEENLAALRSLQILLLGEIMRTERTIRKLKGELKGVQANGGKTAVKRSCYLKGRIERVRDVAYVWRCFGDAVAFLYMDKHSLKQTYFNTHNINPKNDRGFFSDKEGLGHEIHYVEWAFKHKLPALLTDLTNTLRHGDVCVMIGPDPHLVEVKASGGLDRRGRRQRDAIEKLQKFFEDDQTDELRGLRNIHRVGHATPEINYVTEFNVCLAEAREKGYALCKPEHGVAYVVLTDRAPEVGSVLSEINFRRPWFVSWNEWKSHRAWSPRVPFTLNIRAKDDLWDFIRGDVYIMVVIDFEAFCDAARAHGCDASLDFEDTGQLLRLTIPGLNEPASASGQLLERSPFELVSPAWLVASGIDVVKRGFAEAEKQDAPA